MTHMRLKKMGKLTRWAALFLNEVTLPKMGGIYLHLVQ